MNNQIELDKVFLSYQKILLKLKNSNITTKSNKEITHKDLRLAVDTMMKKHSKCRWKSTIINSKRYFILYEGYLWIRFVYFQKEKNIIDADIDFFKMRIGEYEKFLNLNHKEIFTEEICVDDLEKFFNRSKGTIKRAILKMIKADSSFRNLKNNKYVVSASGMEWLCKNCFRSEEHTSELQSQR